MLQAIEKRLPACRTAISASISVAFNRVFDTVFPPQCLLCGSVVDNCAGLCGQCWSRVDFIEPPYCPVSGIPFDFDPGPEALHPSVLARKPTYARARAVMRYDQRAGRLVSRFKYGDRMDCGPIFARWMVRAGAELLADADLIVPVPLHWTRLFRRRFNQAMELAKGIGRIADIPVDPTVLARVRRTRPQVGLSAAQRRRNLAGAIRLSEHAPKRLAGMRVVLIDDVMTSGITTEACARQLRHGGAERVDVLTLARVVVPVVPTI